MKETLTLLHVLTLCVIFMLSVAVPSMANAALERAEEWVARYNGPGNDPDGAGSIAVDTSGNVYVTGRSDGIGTNYDYATVKYDTDGNQLWEARYNGQGGFGDDSARAIAVDTSGNVYVTGRSDGIGTDYDYATVKYNTDGNQLWEARYNGPGNDSDEASAIVVDGSGNVYVFGKSRSSETSYDYATVKYDTNGNQLWEARYNGPGNDSDEARAMVVDALGNVYVTGWSWSGTDYDYATLKYNTNGNQLWEARYNSPGNREDTPSAIAVDPLGNVYVTGSSESIGMASDYATVKYGTDGNQLWVAEYNGLEDLDDWANAISVDVSGNIYVTGSSEGIETGSDYATVKYDNHGNQLWVARYNGPENDTDGAIAIAVDVSGNLYVTGKSGSWLDYDYATVKYDTDGNQLWMAQYNGPGNKRDGAKAIVVDTSGNVYVTGESDGSGTGSDYATMKYGKVDIFEVTMALPKEWSFISLPIKPDVATVTALFPEAVVVYKYEETLGYFRVQEGENLEVGKAYWILLDNPQSYVIRGTEITEYTIPVENDWYIIGGCSMPAQPTVTSGKVDVIYYCTPIGYIRLSDSEPLEPGTGYWILFSDTSEGATFTASTSVSE